MSATSQSLPTYVWEPTTDSLAAKYRLPRESIVRFDVNTSSLPPDLSDVLVGSFDPPLCEYPPSDYAALVAAAADALSSRWCAQHCHPGAGPLQGQDYPLQH